jgi:hypothetical protein
MATDERHQMHYWRWFMNFAHSLISHKSIATKRHEKSQGGAQRKTTNEDSNPCEHEILSSKSNSPVSFFVLFVPFRGHS